MNKTGPIILIDDDTEDIDLFTMAFNSLDVPNEILTFSKADAFIEYMSTTLTKPFMVLCDVNMPNMDGFELREKLEKDATLSRLAIPFIFLSTSSAAHQVSKAYQGSIQGYFVKPSSYSD